jgi:catechol 2,3-dioxygenase-like lactoylglutathione lyase family enzyme
MSARLYRVILPVSNIDAAVTFYSALLVDPGFRVSPGRHYFRCGDVTVALYDPTADGDQREPRPNFDYVYFAVNDIESVYTRATQLGGLLAEIGDGQLPMGQIAKRPWGERSFYMRDPSGNPICFVDAQTIFAGKPG